MIWRLLNLFRSAKGLQASVDTARDAVGQLRRGAHQLQTTLFQRIRQKATAGDRQAQYELGEYYYQGRGVPPDPREALHWFHQAAQQGHPNAQCSVGLMYSLGRGVEKDPVEGYKWLLLAAGQGDPTAIAASTKSAQRLTSAQQAEAQQRVSTFKSPPKTHS